ncbi:MAG: phenylacetate--CoA ligase family protein, partial [Candidatus Coatesbacteria bacterium]|nr:phenylacetate--CoA ligase family protein [Candidatus Coatesbacteria bacterium]
MTSALAYLTIRRGPRLERFRAARLREVLSFAYARVPAYRDLFDEAGVDVEGIRGFEDMSQLPIIDKSFFRSRPIEDFYSGEGFGELAPRRTSGSTGVSLLFVHSQRNRMKRIMVDLRANLRLGLRPRHVHLVVASPEAMKRPRNILQKLGFFRREYVSADDDPEFIARRLSEINPHLLQCYPSHLLLLARLADRGRIGNLKRIISAGEVLTDDARAAIEAAFGVEVTNYYGLKELGMIAWECFQHNGMHINWDFYHVEQHPDTGELIITLLDDEAMPFIRYNTLDRGRLDFSPCPCGCPFPRIVEVEGRSDDCLLLSDGSLIPPLRVNFVDFTGHTQADAYQIRQERPGHIE